MGRKANYRTNPPLPFQGNRAPQKTQFMNLLKKLKDGNNKVFVDLFGGSFYLSYLIHLTFPDAKIICNDFDDYKSRLDHITETLALIKQIQDIVKEEKLKKIEAETKTKIDDILKNHQGFLDLTTLANNLIFSSYSIQNLDNFLKHDYWNLLTKCNYQPDVSDYLNGIEITKADWFDVFNQYKDLDNVIFIADPPSLNSGLSKNPKVNWTLLDSLKALDVLKSKSFLFYCSNKPGTIDIINYIKQNGTVFTPFNALTYKRNSTNHGENILYCFDEKTLEELEAEEKALKAQKRKRSPKKKEVEPPKEPESTEPFFTEPKEEEPKVEEQPKEEVQLKVEEKPKRKRSPKKKEENPKVFDWKPTD